MLVDDVNFWQREAHRYDALSRRLMVRLRTEIALGLTALGSIITVAVNNDIPFLMTLIPFTVAAAWSLALLTAQESFLADAHLMYAEYRISHAFVDQGLSPLPSWADNGGYIARRSFALKIMIGVWVAMTGGALLVACIYTWFKLGPYSLLTILVIGASVISIVVYAIGLILLEINGRNLFRKLRNKLGVSKGVDDYNILGARL